jgi:hypothetical protein
MHKMHKSEVQLTRCNSPGPEVLLLLKQYHKIILMLQKELLPSDWPNKGRSPSKYFLRSQIISNISIP